MKFIMAVVVYLLMAAFIGAGILLLMHGKPWLLIVSALAYLVAFAKIGCMSH